MFGPIGTGIGAVAGGIFGGLSGGKGEDEAKKAKERQRQRAVVAASPGNLIENVRRVQPAVTNMIRSGIGPQFQSGVATNIARRGLTGTGIGTAMQNAALAAPGVFATQAAIPIAQQISSNQLGAELGVPPFINPLTSTGQIFTPQTLGGLAGTVGTFSSLFPGKKAGPTSTLPLGTTPGSPFLGMGIRG
jgi:hypothetical protein